MRLKPIYPRLGSGFSPPAVLFYLVFRGILPLPASEVKTKKLLVRLAAKEL